eukprot:6387-Eustigmatos_ZCMA.PRE.1
MPKARQTHCACLKPHPLPSLAAVHCFLVHVRAYVLRTVQYCVSGRRLRGDSATAWSLSLFPPLPGPPSCGLNLAPHMHLDLTPHLLPITHS